MKKIIVCDPISEEAAAKIRSFVGVELTVKTGMGAEELIQTIPGYHCMVVRSATKVTKPVLDAATDLKLVIRGGVGLDNIDADYASSKGVVVRNTPGASSASVAELAVALMFACARQLGMANNAIKAGQWPKKACKGTEIGGKTLGILGLGRIGKEVAKRAIALGMKVIGYDPFVKCVDIDGLHIVAKDELVKVSDFITLHLPFDPAAGPVIGHDEFAAMKKGVILINCARGGVVDEKALTEGLKSGKVAAAGFDVFDEEPPVYREFVEMPQVVCTPHVGAQTEEAQARVGAEIVEIIEDWVRTKIG